MSLTGCNDSRVRLFEEYLSELECIPRSTRTPEDARVSADSHDAAEYLRGDAVRRRSVYYRLEPSSVFVMSFGVRPESVNEDIHVWQNQARPSIRSSRLALSSRLTPGSGPPPARHSGSFTTGRSERLSGRRSTSCRPCSISDVSVTPRREASWRARASSDSSRRTVVRICRSIFPVCRYVKVITARGLSRRRLEDDALGTRRRRACRARQDPPDRREPRHIWGPNLRKC